MPENLSLGDLGSGGTEAAVPLNDQSDMARPSSFLESWRTEVIRANEDIIEFRFHYQDERDPNEECITWRDLDRLKREKRWSDVRKPIMLNFINERLLECAAFYTLHIIAYFTFLLLLSWHVCERTVTNNSLIVLLLLVFFAGMVLKFVVAVERHDCSLATLLGGSLNVLTYAATLYYVATPEYYVASEDQERFKNSIMWLCPIIAIFSAWLNILYILRRSPYGVYIFMMTRILRSFGHIAVIWIPTLLAFSFAFHLMLRDTDIEPWNSARVNNSSVLLGILMAFTKTSTMMIGEVDAKDMLGPLQWINCLLVLLFNIITVILLMNLMISLAVGDVMDLRRTAQDEILKSKVLLKYETYFEQVDFIIDVLIVWEALGKCVCTKKCRMLTANELTVSADGTYHARHNLLELSSPIQDTKSRASTLYTVNTVNDDSFATSYSKWLIGLEWNSYLNHKDLVENFASVNAQSSP